MSRHLFISDSHGVYIPQLFIESYIPDEWEGIKEEDAEVLRAGPEHEYYWETWDMVLSNARYTGASGCVESYLWQDGDLWLVEETPSPEQVRAFAEANGLDPDAFADFFDELDPYLLDEKSMQDLGWAWTMFNGMNVVREFAEDHELDADDFTAFFYRQELPRLDPFSQEDLREALASYKFIHHEIWDSFGQAPECPANGSF